MSWKRRTTTASVLAVAAGAAAAMAPGAQASGEGCPLSPQPGMPVTVDRGVPFDAVVGQAPCLPAGETLSAVVIDWNDGTPPTTGAVSYVANTATATRHAYIRGAHTYNTSCPFPTTDWLCPPIQVKITAVTDSDGASVTPQGAGMLVRQPALVTQPVPIPDRPGPAEAGPPAVAATPVARVTTRKAGTFGRSGVTVAATFSGPGTAVVTLTLGRVKLTARHVVAAAGTRKLVVPITGKAWAALRGRRAATGTVKIQLRADGRVAAETTRSVRLVRRR